MNKLIRVLVILPFLLGGLAFQHTNVFAQTGTGGDSSYFPQTGHTVEGDFWKFYQANANAQQLFGYPLTEAFQDAKSGRLVQYFTRVRFEFYPEMPEGQRVRLSPLGKYIYEPNKNTAIDFFSPVGCRSFSNGKSVCYAFLEFYDKYGGEAVFGQPLSTFEFLNGRLVQYFERARFDWHPEYQTEKVVLANLGSIYFDFADEDPALLDPVPPTGTQRVLSLRVRAFVWKAVIKPPEAQTVYVIVQDQTLRPVKDALAYVTIYWADGTPQSINLWTNEYGVVLIPFEVKDQTVGSLVTVKVDVFYEGLKQSTQTSFRIWR